jgi:hypothetical protein
VEGQLSVESLLLVLLALGAVGGFFLFLNRFSSTAMTGAEESVIYAETPPQILAMKCYTTYGYIAVAEDLSGTINFQVRNFNGTVANTSSVTVNITGYGRINFTAAMEDDIDYTVRFFTPQWSVTETCRP